MGIYVQTAYKSLNKKGEELCGDKVRIMRRGGTLIAVLADGLGSGVKANILATLTSQILSTMLYEGASVREAVETIAKTLPVCSVRKLAYSTFSILEINENGDGYLAEFDNPFCFYLRGGEQQEFRPEYNEYSGRGVYETHFKAQPGDIITLVSDGVIWAGVGDNMNFGWTWDSVLQWLQNAAALEMSAPQLTVALSDAVNDLYHHRPGDDSTVLVAEVLAEKPVNLLAGPPEDKAMDARMVREFMASAGAKAVCGGTSANIVARELGRQITTSLDYIDKDVPPIGHIQGIDLCTEGVLTLNKALEILGRLIDCPPDDAVMDRLEKKDGAALLAKLMYDGCTTLKMFIGTAINPAHSDPSIQSELSMKLHLLDKLAAAMEKMGKRVEKIYY